MSEQPGASDGFALRLNGICKAYVAPVLIDVDFDLRAGEVHALVGANGAGKSTLSRIICGLTSSEAGAMRLFGKAYTPKDKADAEEAGVHIVQQELNLLPTLTVGENLFLNRLPHRLGFVSRRRLHDRSAQALAAVGLQNVSPDTPVSRLGVGQQQLVEIASALSRHLRILILDEPTAMLTGPEVELLFQRIRELREAGAALIYISHRMEEIRAIADRVTVLRDGRMIGTYAARQASVENMVSLMVGPERSADSSGSTGTLRREPREPGPVVLQVNGLCRGSLVQGVSFEVHRGEILGLSGLVGSGRSETLRAIYGADASESGSVAVGDPPKVVRIRAPRDAVRAGIGMLPEDRKGSGLLLPQSIAMNISLARAGEISAGGWLRRSRERDVAEEYRRRLDIRCTGLDQPVGRLSGGNQQKVLLARWLLRDCDVLLCDEPTRGIDVAARSVIYARLDELARQGKAIVVVSSDLAELMELCDRIGVISAGRMAGVFCRDEWNEDILMAAAFSGYVGQRGTMSRNSGREAVPNHG